MPQVIGFDVYGTLVDPMEMGMHLEAFIGERAKEFSQLWHDKKVEYAFRRGLMQQYQDFGVCTLQASRYCMKVFQIELAEQSQQQLMTEFSHLKAFSEVVPAYLLVATGQFKQHAPRCSFNFNSKQRRIHAFSAS